MERKQLKGTRNQPMSKKNPGCIAPSRRALPPPITTLFEKVPAMCPMEGRGEKSRLAWGCLGHKQGGWAVHKSGATGNVFRLSGQFLGKATSGGHSWRRVSLWAQHCGGRRGETYVSLKKKFTHSQIGLIGRISKQQTKSVRIGDLFEWRSDRYDRWFDRFRLSHPGMSRPQKLSLVLMELATDAFGVLDRPNMLSASNKNIPCGMRVSETEP